MATIDLIVLGILNDQALSGYDIQKIVEYRNISKWVKISTPSIYKKVIQLQKKGYIKGTTVKEGKMPEKEIYTLTMSGKQEFETLMLKTAEQPIRIFLDFNAVIVNLDKLDHTRKSQCLNNIQRNIMELKHYLEDNLNAKKDIPDIPQTGLAVLQQQYILVQAIETWIASLKPSDE